MILYFLRRHLLLNIFFFVNFGDGNWRQAETWIVLLAGAVEVNALAALAQETQQFTQWLWIEHPTFQLRGGHFTTELCRPRWIFLPVLSSLLCWPTSASSAVVAYCCDRKSRAACAQSFAPWQQATIEITRRDHSIIACSHHAYIFLFFAHIPFVVNHTTQRHRRGCNNSWRLDGRRSEKETQIGGQ